MKTVLVEDNPSARSFFCDLIKSSCPDVELVDIATNVEEGVKLITHHQPELVFLDVEMPDGDGFELLSRLPEVNFQVVFITAFEHYALKAIKYSALDYLLKPIYAEELVLAVNKARAEISMKSTHQKIETLMDNMNGLKNDPEKLVLKDKYGVQIVRVNDVIRLEASGGYTTFVLKDQDPLMVSTVLKEYEAMLPKDQFFRSHQSHLINLDYLLRYDKREGDFLHLNDGSKIPLATRKKEALLQKIKAK